MADQNAPLVVVFHAGEPQVLPLATAALEQEGIEYMVRRSTDHMPTVLGRSAEFDGTDVSADVLVTAADAERAQSILADLARDPDAPPAAVPIPSPGPGEPANASRPYRLNDAETGAVVGDITEHQLSKLTDELEEESDTDRDYYIDAATIDMLADAGADADLIAMLRHALGSRDGFEVTWTRR